GAAVAFKLAHALLLSAADASEDPESQRLRLERGLIPSFLKLVAIATIADSVPLEGENRVIAALGLRELRNPVQPGLPPSMPVAQIPPTRAPTATEVGFRLAPRINAAGRMDIASDVVELFLTKDATRAAELAEKLNRLNDERRATEAKALEAIDAQLAILNGTSGALAAECLILDDPTWHRGVLGILASRVVDRTGRPALVLTHEDGYAHGSGRSISGFHLLDALTAIDSTDAGKLVSRFGGHAHPVGFSLPSGSVGELRNRMVQYAAQWRDGAEMVEKLECDAEVRLGELTVSFFAALEQMGPFGNGNAEPVFISKGVRLAMDLRVVKERHLRLAVEDTEDGVRFGGMAWSRQ